MAGKWRRYLAEFKAKVALKAIRGAANGEVQRASDDD